MKPPKDTTIIATPLANCWLESRLMCVDNVNCDRTTVNVDLHYKILKGIVGAGKICWLKRFPACDRFNTAVRRLAATSLPGMCGALAIVTTKDSEPALVESYKELKRKGVPVEVFTQEREARNWLLKNCES